MKEYQMLLQENKELKNKNEDLEFKILCLENMLKENHEIRMKSHNNNKTLRADIVELSKKVEELKVNLHEKDKRIKAFCEDCDEQMNNFQNLAIQQYINNINDLLKAN